MKLRQIESCTDQTTNKDAEQRHVWGQFYWNEICAECTIVISFDQDIPDFSNWCNGIISQKWNYMHSPDFADGFSFSG